MIIYTKQSATRNDGWQGNYMCTTSGGQPFGGFALGGHLAAGHEESRDKSTHFAGALGHKRDTCGRLEIGYIKSG